MSIDPYQPPKAHVSDTPAGESAPALWNPGAAANWSLLFTPAFGAWLHMLNWRALGEPARAEASKGWLAAGLVLMVVYVLMGALMVDPARADGASRGIALIFLFTWYFASARAQAKHVRERFGKDYPRRGWGKPVGYALLAWIGFIAAAAAVGFIFSIVMQR